MKKGQNKTKRAGVSMAERIRRESVKVIEREKDMYLPELMKEVKANLERRGFPIRNDFAFCSIATIPGLEIKITYKKKRISIGRNSLIKKKKTK